MLQPYRKFRFALPKPRPAKRRPFVSHRGHEVRVMSNPFGRKRPAPTRLRVAAWCAAFVAFFYIVVDIARAITGRSA